MGQAVGFIFQFFFLLLHPKCSGKLNLYMRYLANEALVAPLPMDHHIVYMCMGVPTEN